MRTIQLYDGKEKYTLASFDSREKAIAFVRQDDFAPKCALYPSHFAEIGMISYSPLWGNAITPEALRAVSYYFGILCGWPMKTIAVECENKSILSLDLTKNPMEENFQKLKIYKQSFAKSTVFSSSASHDAILVQGENSFLLIESDLVNAVDLSTAELLRTEKMPRIDSPICFASLSDDALQLRACKRGRGEVCADDLSYMHALAYFLSIGRAVPDRMYAAAGGLYRIRGSAAESLRALSVISTEGGAYR